MRILMALAFAAALAACSPPAEKTAPPPSVDTPVTLGMSNTFQSPTGNIGCVYIPAGGTAVYQSPSGGAELQCDRVAPTYVRVTMYEHGTATILNAVGDAGCCGGEMLGYGQRWSQGPFSCTMSDSGLSCSNADLHGFSLSREGALTN